MEAKVVYGYVAREPDELTIKQGDTIQNVSPSNIEGWLLGTLDGQSGVFPGNFVELIEYNGTGSTGVEVEEEWWKGKMEGEVEVFSSNRKIPPNHATHGRNTSRPILSTRNTPSYPTHSSKRVTTVKPKPPEEIIIPVPHITSEETAAEHIRNAQQVSKMDPTRIQSMEEKLRNVFPESPLNSVPSGSSSLPGLLERGVNPGMTSDVFDLVSNFQMKKGGTVTRVTPIANSDERDQVAGQGGPTINYSSPQLNSLKNNPRNISSSSSPQPPAPPPFPSHSKLAPRKGNLAGSSLDSMKIKDASPNTPSKSFTMRAAPPPPPPPAPPRIPAPPTPKSSSSSISTTPVGDDDTGRNAVLDSIRTFNKAKLKGVATADAPSPQRNGRDNGDIFVSTLQAIRNANIGREDSLEEPDDNENWD